ncbi:MAG: LysR family transcriptional regulator [Faecousia sp.]
MSIKQYEAFVKTAELGSLTKAAEALDSTQSRISHVLSAMEEEYGFCLMKRGRGGVSLTEAGALLLPKMEAVLRQNREVEALIADIRNADTGTVRLGAFTSVAVHWLPGMIQAFQALHPQVELKMFNGDYFDVAQWLRDGTVDLAFVTLPEPENTRAIPLAEDELMAILPKGHPLAAQARIDAAKLGREPFISLPQSSDHDIHRALDRAGITPNIRYTTKDDYAVIAMVERGLGVSIVPELLVRGRAQNVELRALQPRATRTIALALPQGTVSPAVEAFAECAVEWVKENG